MSALILEQHYQMVQHLDNAMKMALIARLQQDVQQNKPLNDLSKLVEHKNVINGDFDDLLNVSWEKELNLDFPK